MIKNIFIVTLIISILLHWSSYWGSSYFSTDSKPFRKQKKWIEVEISKNTEPKKDTDLQAPIRFAEAPKELLDDQLESLKKKVDLLSEKAQRVKKETQAKLIGMTKNRQTKVNNVEKRINTMERDKNQNSLNSLKKEPLDENGIKVATQNERKSIETLDPGLSTFGNTLNKKIEIGNFTALNTDYHLYGSFYSRIEDLIREPWENTAREEYYRQRDLKTMSPKNGWTTRIDVILNSNGELQKLILLKSSGNKKFDEAALNAFQKASFFPHPPKGMVRDGKIVLKYSFVIHN